MVNRDDFGLMKTLLNPWFLLFCLLWMVFYLAKINHHPILFLQGYFTDLLAVPVIANLGLWFQRIFTYKRSIYILKPGHVIFIVIYLCLVFEWLLPKYFPHRFTGDWIDVLLYFLGGLFFLKLMNKPLPQNSANTSG